MKFSSFFDLILTHSYYSDGRCLDFTIEPTTVTRKLLNNYRYILKTRPDRVQVFRAVTEQNESFIPLSKNTVFSFLLKLKSIDFALYTDLSNFQAKGFPIYSNKNNNEGLDEVVARKPLTLEFDDHQKSADIFAKVNIHLTDSSQKFNNEFITFEIAFAAKQMIWKYYFVTNLNEQGSRFQIKDEDDARTDSPMVFNIDSSTNQVSKPIDKISDMLEQQYPDMKQFHFLSKQPIICRQAARKNIQLYFDGNKISENLPNPSVHNYSQLVVGENQSLQDSLFQIIKYITRPFPTP